ncbi:ABC transporter ATP-binding protein [Paracoccus albus]|uniref:ABC transporter ATP-binding protein n=1 Tax=Paracoccus albus TaxID=3017784 RepID=UPI0022F03F61|nr:ABC transporter ATP-binding protein [Paracoccus albus]WBU59744.1 ABC transporter ATP-binding protein [Paracoccus albus]
MSLPLDVRELSVSAKGRVLLTIPRLELAAGSLTAIRGPSGAGKTTALHALAGLVPAKGQLSWGRYDLTRLSQSQRTQFRRENLGMIFQDFLLFEELSGRENALISTAFRPERAVLAARVDRMMQEMGIAGLSARRADLLSGGERQRIAVVRALAHDPPVLLADEPTASLDRAAADRLIEDLSNQARRDGRTVVVVSHDENVWSAMDQVLTIRDGRLHAA